MKSIIRITGICITVVTVPMISIILLKNANFELLNPAGEIGSKQRDLLYFTVLLSLIVVVPVFALTFYIVKKYRVDNPKTLYDPEWEGGRKLELLWWAIPFALIAILAVVTFVTSHSLDPRKPIASDQPPLKVQVVALNWKWLFIYPDYDVATLNYVKIPKDTPVEFTITSEGPMNSFSIPQLGGQIYAMAGMSTKLNLIANQTGTFRGQSANLSGEGFADMNFEAISTDPEEFSAWLTSTASAPSIDYNALIQPSRRDLPTEYNTRMQPDLYDTIVAKYMGHGSRHGSTNHMQRGMEY